MSQRINQESLHILIAGGTEENRAVIKGCLASNSVGAGTTQVKNENELNRLIENQEIFPPEVAYLFVISNTNISLKKLFQAAETRQVKHQEFFYQNLTNKLLSDAVQAMLDESSWI